MPGKGPPPKHNRIDPSQVPLRGEWAIAAGVGWQDGEVPEPPAGISDEAAATWRMWMASWVAAHWTRHDLAGLTATVHLLDLTLAYHADPIVWRQNDDGTWSGVRRPSPYADLRQWMDTYGITPKGQQDRRWSAPAEVEAPRPASKSPYARLRAAS